MRFREFNLDAPPEGLAGTRGPAVAALQQGLQALGYNLGPKGVDGIYGPATTSAVRTFQTDAGIKVDGDAGPETANALKKAVPKGIKLGSHSQQKGADALADLELAKGSGSGRVKMANSGKIRNQAINSRLMDILEKASEEAGVDVVVFSGGQPRKGSGGKRTGSIRHDDGLAADIWLYSGGKRLRTDNKDPIVAKFIASAVAAGARGIGAGPGYMDNVGIHVDLWGSKAGGTIWGAGGKSSNAPSYVAQAYQAGMSGGLA